MIEFSLLMFQLISIMALFFLSHSVLNSSDFSLLFVNISLPLISIFLLLLLLLLLLFPLFFHMCGPFEELFRRVLCRRF